MRRLHIDHIDRLRFDLSGYRRAVRNLQAHQATTAERDVIIGGLEAVALYNEFGHLLWIDQLLEEQSDLFECCSLGVGVSFPPFRFGGYCSSSLRLQPTACAARVSVSRLTASLSGSSRPSS